MNSTNLIESFSELKDLKNIDRNEMSIIMQDIFRTIITKKYGSSKNFHIIINPSTGDLGIMRNRIIVDDDYEHYDEIEHVKLSDALKVESDFEVGEEISEQLKIEEIARRSISTIKQILKSKIFEQSKLNLCDKYKHRIGELITGQVHQVLQREIIILDDDGAELFLPKNQQIFGDFYKKGDSIKAIIKEVMVRNNITSIMLSRTSPDFLSKIMESEIPEIFDGLITIKKVVREPGLKAKVTVESYDDRIDPVGLCIGSRGSRIKNISRELGNEQIDIIEHSNNDSILLLRALTGNTKGNVEFNTEKKRAKVIITQKEMSAAIGKKGININLASKLLGYRIDLKSTDSDIEEDVLLDEFLDEIDGWIINILKSIGCNTARDVLKIDKNNLMKDTDLEEETINEIIRILDDEVN